MRVNMFQAAKSLDDALAIVTDGCMLVVPREVSGVPMAATRELIRRGIKRLHLVALPTSSLQADMMIGAGCVETLETSAVSLGEFGPAPRFNAAIISGAIKMKDATCPALHAGLQAAEKGVPFMPLRGLIGSDSQLSAEQLRLLIFEPGFSTRESVSDLSGRGVGMDVVKRNVQQLNGTVALASERGLGSTVTIELPLTLAILDGLLIRVGDRTLVLPLLSVIETVPLPAGTIVRMAERGEVVVIRSESIPLLRLSRFLGLDRETASLGACAAETGDRGLAVIVETGRCKVGMVVDELLGQQQVVVKSLERHLRKVDGLMGATITGDGRVAPIVDVAGIAALDLYALQVQSRSPSPSGVKLRSAAGVQTKTGKQEGV